MRNLCFTLPNSPNCYATATLSLFDAKLGIYVVATHTVKKKKTTNDQVKRITLQLMGVLLHGLKEAGISPHERKG